MLLGATAPSVAAQTLHRDTQTALTDAIDQICAPVMQGGDAARLLAAASARGWKPISGASSTQVERSTPDGRIVTEWPSIFKVCKISLHRRSLIDDNEGYRITDNWAKRQPGMTMTGTIETAGSRNIYKWSSPQLLVELRSRYKPDDYPDAPQDYLLIRSAS